MVCRGNATVRKVSPFPKPTEINLSFSIRKTKNRFFIYFFPFSGRLGWCAISQINDTFSDFQVFHHSFVLSMITVYAHTKRTIPRTRTTNARHEAACAAEHRKHSTVTNCRHFPPARVECSPATWLERLVRMQTFWISNMVVIDRSAVSHRMQCVRGNGHTRLMVSRLVMIDKYEQSVELVCVTLLSSHNAISVRCSGGRVRGGGGQIESINDHFDLPAAMPSGKKSPNKRESKTNK